MGVARRTVNLVLSFHIDIDNEMPISAQDARLNAILCLAIVGGDAHICDQTAKLKKPHAHVLLTSDNKWRSFSGLGRGKSSELWACLLLLHSDKSARRSGCHPLLFFFLSTEKEAEQKGARGCWALAPSPS